MVALVLSLHRGISRNWCFDAFAGSASRQRPRRHPHTQRKDIYVGPASCRRLSSNLIFGTNVQQHKLMVNRDMRGRLASAAFRILVKANAKSVSWIKRRKLSLKAKSQVKLSACHFAAFGARADTMPLLGAGDELLRCSANGCDSPSLCSSGQ